jgi:hypothetical protein
VNTVFVVFGPVVDPKIGTFAERLRRAFPRRIFIGSGTWISAGVYDSTPVTIALVRAPDVSVEAKEMAEELARNGVPPAVVEAVRASTVRFELDWDIERDPDPILETADHIVEWAQELAAVSGGVPIVNGHLLTGPDQLI